MLFRMALSKYLKTAVGYIWENFVSEKKILGKVLQSTVTIIYLIGSISIAHGRLFF